MIYLAMLWLICAVAAFKYTMHVYKMRLRAVYKGSTWESAPLVIEGYEILILVALSVILGPFILLGALFNWAVFPYSRKIK